MLFALMMTMLLGGLWHGASWNFVLWGLIHGLLLIVHRLIKKMSMINSLFEKLPRTAPVLGWVITQYFIFMTWLIFRLEDTKLLIPSLKTFIGINAHWDTTEMLDTLPTIKYLTLLIAILFFICHFISWKVGGLKHWISKQNPIVWGLINGIMLGLVFMLRPAETVDFIYFRF